MKFLTHACLLTFLFVFGLFGCATFDKNVNSERLLVQVATMKVIERGDTAEDRSLRAQRIVAIAGEAKSVLNTDSVTIDLLKSKVLERIDGLNLQPSDRLLATVLVQTVVDELSTRVVNEMKVPVPPEQFVYQVNTVLTWVVDAAKVYQ